MPVRASDIIIDRMHEDGYSLGETSWLHPITGEHCWQFTATRDGHDYIASVPNREQAVVQLGRLVGYPLDE